MADNDMRGKISASIMCADLFNLEKEIRELEDCGVDYLHLDIMDGNFVPNITLGLDLIRKIADISDIPRDIHLLVNHPERYIDTLDLKQSDMITFHYESTIGLFDTMDKVSNVIETLKLYRQKGCKVGIVLNPETPVDVLKSLISYLDIVNLMMVHPGFAGLKMIDGAMDKIYQTRQLLDESNGRKIELEVDGNITLEKINIIRRNGGNIFVAGTSMLFKKDIDKKTVVDIFRKGEQNEYDKEY